MSTTPLSARVRPGSTAAPWVIDEIHRLEAQLATALDAAAQRAEPWRSVGTVDRHHHGAPP
jgi:hypothetical protein